MLYLYASLTMEEKAGMNNERDSQANFIDPYTMNSRLQWWDCEKKDSEIAVIK